ncbi:2-isopropylmalate synthase, partial [Klebsiella pneumoniae]|nr:2-isopropylmalate synthase [Klebsiella pneumoniae]
NLYSQGIDPELRYAQMNRVVEVVANCNQIPVHPRHPWAGSRAYTAFSGSRQAAINIGVAAREAGAPGQMPYLPLDP